MELTEHLSAELGGLYGLYGDDGSGTFNPRQDNMKKGAIYEARKVITPELREARDHFNHHACCCFRG